MDLPFEEQEWEALGDLCRDGFVYCNWDWLTSLLKWAFIVLNVLIGVLLYRKVHHQNKYEKQLTEHHRNPNRDRVAIVIAHPDDEAMFFAPVIQELVAEGKELTVICFSNGNFDGLGKVREKELRASCDVLGVKGMHIIDHPELQDGPKEKWSPILIAEILRTHTEKEKYGTLITFDEDGVSSHPNHISVHYGVRQFYEDASANWDEQKGGRFQVMVLDSTNILRKYIGLFDAFFSVWAPVVFIRVLPTASFRAMKAHHSQFVWFRRLFVIFSRYGYLNTLRPLD